MGDPGEGEHFTTGTWATANSDPDSHRGASVDVIGQVFLEPERDAEGVYFQMYVDGNSNYNTVVGYADPSFELATDDYVAVRGTLEGELTGENAFGAALSLPTIAATVVETIDAAALDPALETLEGGQYSEGGIKMTIDRIEVGSKETRAYVAFRNRSNYEFAIYTFSSKLIVDGRQYDPDYSSNYPELSTELLPGARTTGVVVFPAVSPSATRYEIHVEGSSDNTDVGDYGQLEWDIYWE